MQDLIELCWKTRVALFACFRECECLFRKMSFKLAVFAQISYILMFLCLFIDPKRPDLSQYQVYEAHMEANIVNRNYTIDYTEYFDYPNKRAATHITKSGKPILHV